MPRKSRYNSVRCENIIESSATYEAGLYIRLSSENGDYEEYNSIGNQKKIGLDYVKDRADVHLRKIYVDNGYSGMTFNRPDFLEMMKDIDTGLINCIIVKDISRLGRHFIRTSEYVDKIFPYKGVRLICINDNFDSMNEQADTSLLLLPFKMVMNDSYVHDISRKIRSSITTHMKNGDFLPPAGSVPYGYIRNPQTNTYDIDTETFEVVIRIFEMRAKGMKYNTIAKALNMDGIPSPGKIRFLRQVTVNPKYERAEWNRKTVKHICNDLTYVGSRVHGKVKRDKVGEVKKRRDESEWMIIPDAHVPIISDELFEKVQIVNQQELKTEADKIKRPDVEDDMRDLLRGKVICGDCKAVMTAMKGIPRANSRLPSFIFYNCGEYLNSQHRRCCNHYIRGEDVKHALKTLLDKQINLMVNFESFMDEVSHMPKMTKYQMELQKRKLYLRKQRAALREKIDNMLEDLARGIIDRDMYEYAKKHYEEEMNNIMLEENEISISIGKLEKTLSTASQWVETIKRYEKLPEIDRELVDKVVDYIEVYSNKEILIHLTYGDPFAYLKDYIQKIPEVKRFVG